MTDCKKRNYMTFNITAEIMGNSKNQHKTRRGISQVEISKRTRYIFIHKQLQIKIFHSMFKCYY